MRRFITCLTMVAMLFGFIPSVGATDMGIKNAEEYLFLTADNFVGSLGLWSIVAVTKDTEGAYGDKFLQGGKLDANQKQPAVASIQLKKAGTYYVWGRSMDFATNSPGTRTSQLQMGEMVFEQQLGAHMEDGWKWTLLGSADYAVGEVTLKLTQTCYRYARVDMVMATTDQDFVPPEDLDTLKTLVEQYQTEPEEEPGPDNEDDPDRPDSEYAVKLNGRYMNFDVDPVAMNGEILVPFNAIFGALNCSAVWDEEEEILIGERNGLRIELPIGSNSAYVNQKAIPLDQPALVLDGRVMVPIRFVSETLGATVNWNNDAKTVSIVADIPLNIYLIRPSSFSELGTWKVETNTSGAPFEGKFLIGNKDRNPSAANPAKANINAAKAGEYNLWVRSRDYATNAPGSRFFNVAVNGVMLEQKFGAHGMEGFRWANAGTVSLSEGKNLLEVIDTSCNYARFDAVLLTDDLNYTPSDDYSVLLRNCIPIDNSNNFEVNFPKYAKSVAQADETMQIENSHSRILFYKVNTEKGNVVQNEIYVNDNGNWVKTKSRTEGLGYLLIKAKTGRRAEANSEFLYIDTTYDYDGSETGYLGHNVYKAGVPDWLIPNDFERSEDGSIKLIGSNEDADIVATWSLNPGDENPKVSLNSTFKTDGAFSFGIYEGKTFDDDKYEFALTPFRVFGRRVDQEPGALISEHFAFTPMATITLPTDNEYAPGKHVTKGIVVDPSWIPNRFNNKEMKNLFGLGLRTAYGEIQPSVFAPSLDNDENSFKAGDTYNFRYVVVNNISGWYDTYLSVVQKLFNVTDYRVPYYGSLNTAIFNTRELIMDDWYGGWDKNDMAHYNQEAQAMTVSTTNPMQALQTYLLTEDEEVLRKRAIPTIASLLTKQGMHFTSKTLNADNHYFKKDNSPAPIGNPNSSFGLNVWGGLFEQSQGRTPALLSIGLTNSKSESYTQQLELYRYTKDQKYLYRAIELADKYLNDTVYATMEGPVTYNTFIYNSYYPNLSSLLEIYEATGEKRFLDAAEYVGKLISMVPWVTGIDGDKKNEPVVVNEVDDIKMYGWDDYKAFWRGDVRWRPGTPIGSSDTNNPDYSVVAAKKETVPAWVPSAVGLGLEQATTLGAGFIVMSNWAGDMVKLSHYTGNKYFETVARNAIIGRFTNYPGYYYDQSMTYQMQPEYPYEGIDNTGIYPHHLPTFLSMLEDFLINTVYNWSNANIDFPNIRERGYIYLNSNQYGHAPGKFFDQNDMWLWLDQGMVISSNIGIDYIGAKKDGVLGLVLLNETNDEITETFKLGDKVPGGSSFTGTADLFDRSGKIGTAEINSGEFTLTIPAKTLKAITVNIPGIKKPAYANLNYDITNANQQQTVGEHENGKCYILQIIPENYYAYVYTTDKPDMVKSATLKYKVGNGEEQMVTKNMYPFEFIVEVTEPTKDFTYQIELVNLDGSKKQVQGKTLMPNSSVPGTPKEDTDTGTDTGIGTVTNGGSSSSTNITTVPGNTPYQPVTAAVPVTAIAGANGAAVADILDNAITGAIARAQADAKAHGKTENGTIVELNVTMPKGANSLNAILTGGSLNSLVSAGVYGLTVNSSLLTVTFDQKALAEIQKQSNGDISVTIAQNAVLSGAAQNMIGTRPVYGITVGYGSGKTVSGLGGGTATVSVPYTLGKNEAVAGLYAVYVDAEGKVIRILGSTYDSNSCCVIFTTTHLSLYGIGYTSPSAKFTDISNHWGEDAIDYVVGKGLFSGTSNTTFAPDIAMTRGMLVKVLCKLAGADAKVYTANSFTDVKADSAFRPYIEWAYKNGIVQGIGNSQFAPDCVITREEIAVIFANYAKATGYKLPVIREATAYVDASGIGDAYKTAVTAMQQAGIMIGDPGNMFNPKAGATRTEISAMFHHYIKLTIDPATAQGWALNDVGQYLYYKNGKTLTGTQTINGVKYFFETTGVLKTGWVKEADNWRYYSGNNVAAGWLDISDKRYYFTEDGLMVSSKWLEIDGKWYYFNTDGPLVRSSTVDGYEVDENGVRKTK